MAKAKKANKTAAAVLPLTPANVLINLLKQSVRTSKQVGEINEEMRGALATAKERHHLHTGAFGVVRRMHGMSDEKLAEFHHYLMTYLDTSGIEARVAKVSRLPLGDDDGKVVPMASAAE